MDDKKLLNWERSGIQPRKSAPRRDRWTNWDAEFFNEDSDPWDAIEEKINEAQLLRAHSKKLADDRAAAVEAMISRPLDIAAMSECEYADMYKLPPGFKLPKKPKTQTHKKHDRKRAAEDRQIIADNQFEMRGMLIRKRTLKSIAAEFGISYKIMKQEAKKWQTK